MMASEMMLTATGQQTLRLEKLKLSYTIWLSNSSLQQLLGRIDLSTIRDESNTKRNVTYSPGP